MQALTNPRVGVGLHRGLAAVEGRGAPPEPALGDAWPVHATAFAREVARRGLRPKLAAGTDPKLRHVPFGQPPKGTLLEFVKA